MTFNKARQLFATAKNANKGKPLGTATVLVSLDQFGDSYGIKYHNTVVVEIHINGKYVLRSGGWKTVTTKKRINTYSPVKVYQKNFEWFTADGKPFTENMEVFANSLTGEYRYSDTPAIY